MGKLTIDGNEAAARVAYRLNEVIAIYPITPASPMGELADTWAASGLPNQYGSVPEVIEMQSEGGAAGAVHGALQAGSLTTTFTASQGLLLMLPNMFKIAGELTSCVIHIAARSVATHALSIFCDHSDVMAARGTGWAQLFAGSVQEAQDFALLAQAATMRSRVPFLHVFDGFRTSHEVAKIDALPEDLCDTLIDPALVRAHRARALSPDRPVVRGTAQNPDVFFQSREAVEPYYRAVPGIVEQAFARFRSETGRGYGLFDYTGHPEAEAVIVLLGSAAGAVEEAVTRLTAGGGRVGLVRVRLYRPFSAEHLLAALPTTVRAVAALDRTKEPGTSGEPLYLDVLEALVTGRERFAAGLPLLCGGRYGLGGKELTPAMARGVFEELARPAPRPRFTVGIEDDVSGSSLAWDPAWSTEAPETYRAVFWGLGSDGTVGANKSSIKIIGHHTDLHCQGFFVYDSKKSGARTISHLRFGPEPITASYLIREAQFVGVHQFSFLDKYPVLETAAPGATVLLNSPHPPEEVWGKLPRAVQETLLERKLRLHVIDASALAREVGLQRRINTIMQTAFFALSGILPLDEARRAIGRSIEKTYGKRGRHIVQRNLDAVARTVDALAEVALPAEPSAPVDATSALPAEAPDFVRAVTATLMRGAGDSLPVSALPADGTFPSGTAAWEKRGLSDRVPVWEPDLCIQCGKCVLVCPHATIRAKRYPSTYLEDAPAGFRSMPGRWKESPADSFTIAIASDDCTGCRLCVEICPAKDKTKVSRKALNLAPHAEVAEEARAHWEHFQRLPQLELRDLAPQRVKDSQLLEPLFEFSGACPGCGETPYLRLLSAMFGDRALIANATGCSSIYGGNLPTTPWTKNAAGRGPAWSNSLFEDNAEFGLGMRLAVDKQEAYARQLVAELREELGPEAALLLSARQDEPEQIDAQRERVAALKERLQSIADPRAADLLALADLLVRKSVWLVGGDGWAYDIGYGGLDHALASGRNVNVLVLDTEVYSNTGGQASKATPRAAVAKFAAGGKETPKKDLGRQAMAYGFVYVANLALGANMAHTIRAFREAEAYDGPALLLANSPCIAHGIDMAKTHEHQQLAVDTGYWPLYRFVPDASGGRLFLDSKPPKKKLREYLDAQLRFRMLRASDPVAAARLAAAAQEDVDVRWRDYEELAAADKQHQGA